MTDKPIIKKTPEMEEYEEETGKLSIWKGKLSKDFKKWKEKKIKEEIKKQKLETLTISREEKKQLKKDSVVQDSNWITEEDFKAIFPNNLEYEVRFKNGDEFKGSLFYLWHDVFTDSSFQEKLDDINGKIQIFRNALKDGKNPYVELLKETYPSVEKRFLERALTFATAFSRLGVEKLTPTERSNSAGELAYIWHIYLMKQAFDLE